MVNCPAACLDAQFKHGGEIAFALAALDSYNRLTSYVCDSDRVSLPDNKVWAIHRLKHLVRKLQRNKQYFEGYKAFTNKLNNSQLFCFGFDDYTSLDNRFYSKTPCPFILKIHGCL